MSSPPAKWPMRVFLSLLGLFVFGTALFPIAVNTMWVHGDEFSPRYFAVRKFSYVRLPYFHNRISKVTVDSPNGTVVCGTDITSHLPSSTSDMEDRWDICEVPWKGEVGDAIVLTRFLHSDLKEEWERWSRNHPTRAAMIWPAVQQLALHQAYFAIPELLAVAKSDRSDDKLRTEVDRICIQAAVDLAHQWIEKNDSIRAQEAIDWGLSHGTSEDLQKLQTAVKEKS